MSLLFQSRTAFVEILTEMLHAGSGPIKERSDPNLANWIVVDLTAESLLEQIITLGFFMEHEDSDWIIICTS
jgi:hypothetical protein